MGNQLSNVTHAVGSVASGMSAVQGKATVAARSVSSCLTKDTGGAEELHGVPGVGVGLHAPDVILDGCRVYGEGAAIASTGLHQDRAYFEIKVERNGTWAFGLAKKSAHSRALDSSDGECWVITNKEIDALVGDVLSCTYDQTCIPTCLKFYHNGNLLEGSTREGIKGEVFPALSVGGGAELEYEFDGERGFAYPAPSGFTGVMADRRIM